MLSTRPLPLGGDGSLEYAHARTPAKGLLKNRGVLQENTVLRGGQRTANGKGKAVALRTPQHVSSARKKGPQFVKPTLVVTRPLGDKTPFPNRQAQALQTPAPQTAKLAKLSLLDEGLAKTPGNLLLPSARRKSMRLPRSANKFRTPNAQGNHWDVSDGDVRLDSNEEVEEVLAEEPDYDEIEYMPPKVPEQPFEPLFPLPDYRTVGKTLLSLEYSGLRDDSVDRFYATDIEAVMDIAKLLEESGGHSHANLQLPDISEDDPLEYLPAPTRPTSLSPHPDLQSSTHRLAPPRHVNRRAAASTAKPSPPVTRSTLRVAPSVAQNMTTTRVTRSTSTRNASQTTQPSKPQQVALGQPLKRSATNAASRSTTGHSATTQPARPPSAAESRESARSTAMPTRVPATSARGRPATVTRASSSRASSRAASVRSTSTIAVDLEDDDDLFEINHGNDTFEDDFQFSI